jgi:hypothetical protein
MNRRVFTPRVSVLSLRYDDMLLDYGRNLCNSACDLMLGSGVVKLPSNFMKMTQSILEENEAFCEPNGVAHETWVEIVELMNDAVDNIMWETTDIDWKSAFPRYAMLNYFFSILMPLSYGIYLDFLAGNLPVCFAQLRTLLEQLAKCSASDRKYPELAFFQERVRALEDSMGHDRLSLSKLIEIVAPEGLPIWRNLSKDWIHFRGFDRIVTIVAERQDVPGWSLTIPIGYSDTELPEIEELGKYISQFRRILAKDVEDWKQKVFEHP